MVAPVTPEEKLFLIECLIFRAAIEILRMIRFTGAAHF
jgi:hypothetical protein